MVNTCCIKGCRSESFTNCGISFHSFPKNEILRAKWIEAIGATSCKSAVVCSRHFKKENFKTNTILTRLTDEAVPCIELEPSMKRVAGLSDIYLDSASGTTSEKDIESESESESASVEHQSKVPRLEISESESEPESASVEHQSKVPRLEISESESEPEYASVEHQSKVPRLEISESESEPESASVEHQSKVPRLEISESESELESESESASVEHQSKMPRLEIHEKSTQRSNSVGSKEETLRRKLKTLQQKLNRRDRKIQNLQSMLQKVKKNCTNYDEDFRTEFRVVMENGEVALIRRK